MKFVASSSRKNSCERQNNNDQQRVMTPFQAIRDGADYLVVGRPIRTASDPQAAAESIQADIARAFDGPSTSAKPETL